MKKEILDEAYKKIENFEDKLGENFYDAIQEDDNSTYDMAKGILDVFNDMCETERDFEVADAMLMGACGYNFETLVERIKELDEMGIPWHSC